MHVLDDKVYQKLAETNKLENNLKQIRQYKIPYDCVPASLPIKPMIK